MKKLLSYVICILCAGGLLGQALHAQSIGIGVKAGGALTKLSFKSQLFDEEEDDRMDKTRISFQAGVFVELDYGVFSLQPEVLYSRHRGLTQEDAGIQIDDLEYTFDHVLIPVLAKFETSYGLYGILGPQYGLLVRDEQSTIDVIQRDDDMESSTFGRPLDKMGVPIPPFLVNENGDFVNEDGMLLDPDEDPIQTPISNNNLLREPKNEFAFVKQNFYFVFGGGYEFPFGLGIDVRYNLGIDSVIDDVLEGDHKSAPDKVSASHRVFQVSLTYKIFETGRNQ